MADKDDLLNKLGPLGVFLGADHLKPPQPKPQRPSYSIESVVSGIEYPTEYGPTFVSQTTYPRDHRHGLIPLCQDRPMDILATWASTPRITQPGGENIVFLDTETTGLSTGTGTLIFLVGIGYRTPSGFELVQFFLREPGEEEAFITALDQWLARFDTIVSFNGKHFDLPILANRYLLTGSTPPFDRFEHLDVLQIARKLWRYRLPSRALSVLEKEIVQFYRTQEEVPGFLIPQLYIDYQNTGDARPLAGVFYHNAVDILTLAALYGKIAGMLTAPLEEAAQHSLDLAAIARLYEELGQIETAAELYEASLEQGLPQAFYAQTMERFANMRRRQGEWRQAAQLWRKAAEHGECQACIELAKYYEHRERNYTEALMWSKRALENLDLSDQFIYSRAAVERDIEKRIGRLYKRVYKLMDSYDEPYPGE